MEDNENKLREPVDVNREDEVVVEEDEGLFVKGDDEAFFDSIAEEETTASEGEESKIEPVPQEEISSLSDEELKACITATNDALASKNIPKKIFDWGLDYLEKMYDEQNKRLEQKLNSVNREEARAYFKKEADEEERADAESRAEYIRDV